MTDQEYTLRRDMLRDAIRKTQSELDGLKEELYTLEETHKPFFTHSLTMSGEDFKVFSYGCQVERQRRGVTDEQYREDIDIRLRLQKDVLDVWRRQKGRPKIKGHLTAIFPSLKNPGGVIMRFAK